MQKKDTLKITIMILAISIMLGWNIGSFYLVAYQNVDFLASTQNNQPIFDGPSTNVDELIDPPLGNKTGLPKFTTVFTMFVLNLPIEFSILAIGEVFFGSVAKLDPRRINIVRVLLMLGAATAISVITAVVHYLMVWPALHDLIIHKGLTYVNPATQDEFLQYGGAQTTFSKGVDILLLLFATVIIVGVHYPTIRYIQRLNWKTAIGTMVVPLIFYPVLWSRIAKKVTNEQLMKTTESFFLFALILAGAFIVGFALILLWRLSLIGAAPPEEIEQRTEST